VACGSTAEERSGAAPQEDAANPEATCRIIERLDMRVMTMWKSKRKSLFQRANECSATPTLNTRKLEGLPELSTSANFRFCSISG
jgi:hypothetical protein